MSSKFHSPDVALSPSPAPPDLGALPEWRLQDLYEGMDSPRFAADIERAEREAKLFAEGLSRQARGYLRPGPTRA